MIEEFKEYKIDCKSEYFKTKYGENCTTIVECKRSYKAEFNPAAFLYLGRSLAEGRKELLEGTTYYCHVNGLGEYLHESELIEI